MKNWQRLTRLANSKFHQKALSQAQSLYQQALKVALLSVQSSDAGENEIMALIVSYFNLADLYIELGLLPHAYEQLRQAQQQLEPLMFQEQYSQQLQQAAFRASSKTITQLALFRKNHGEVLTLPTARSEEELPSIAASHPIH